MGCDPTAAGPSGLARWRKESVSIFTDVPGNCALLRFLLKGVAGQFGNSISKYLVCGLINSVFGFCSLP